MPAPVVVETRLLFGPDENRSTSGGRVEAASLEEPGLPVGDVEVPARLSRPSESPAPARAPRAAPRMRHAPVTPHGATARHAAPQPQAPHTPRAPSGATTKPVGARDFGQHALSPLAASPQMMRGLEFGQPGKALAPMPSAPAPAATTPKGRPAATTPRAATGQTTPLPKARGYGRNLVMHRGTDREFGPHEDARGIVPHQRYMRALMDRGFSREDAAAITGNAIFESAGNRLRGNPVVLNPHYDPYHPKGHHAVGSLQWEAKRKVGVTPSLESQAQHAWDEAQGREARAYRAMQRARSIGEKASIFNRLSERPENWRLSDRQRRALAEEAYRRSFSPEAERE